MADQHGEKFARARELMDDLENDILRQWGSRQRALHGPWTCKREELEAFLRPWCYQTPLGGREFDEEVYGFLYRYTAIDLRQAEPRPQPRRRPATAAAADFTETAMTQAGMSAAGVGGFRHRAADPNADALPPVGPVEGAGRRFFPPEE